MALAADALVKDMPKKKRDELRALHMAATLERIGDKEAYINRDFVENTFKAFTDNFPTQPWIKFADLFTQVQKDALVRAVTQASFLDDKPEAKKQGIIDGARKLFTDRETFSLENSSELFRVLVLALPTVQELRGLSVGNGTLVDEIRAWRIKFSVENPDHVIKFDTDFREVTLHRVIQQWVRLSNKSSLLWNTHDVEERRKVLVELKRVFTDKHVTVLCGPGGHNPASLRAIYSALYDGSRQPATPEEWICMITKEAKKIAESILKAQDMGYLANSGGGERQREGQRAPGGGRRGEGGQAQAAAAEDG
jgi:hypothetical protein